MALEIHPLYLLLPVTLSCSYAFMLPVATPPNAIVYSASGMSTSEMVRPDPILFAGCLVGLLTTVFSELRFVEFQDIFFFLILTLFNASIRLTK